MRFGEAQIEPKPSIAVSVDDKPRIKETRTFGTRKDQCRMDKLNRRRDLGASGDNTNAFCRYRGATCPRRRNEKCDDIVGGHMEVIPPDMGNDGRTQANINTLLAKSAENLCDVGRGDGVSRCGRLGEVAEACGQVCQTVDAFFARRGGHGEFLIERAIGVAARRSKSSRQFAATRCVEFTEMIGSCSGRIAQDLNLRDAVFQLRVAARYVAEWIVELMGDSAGKSHGELDLFPLEMSHRRREHLLGGTTRIVYEEDRIVLRIGLGHDGAIG